MLPRILPESTLNKQYANFLVELHRTSYHGEIQTDYAARLSMAVDNSIYQVIPQAVIFPRSTQDIAIVLTMAHQEKFREIKFCPRGGGTSTNGQSLSAGIIIDCSKYMRDILELNLEEYWVRVQPGVVLDQLNTYLKPYGVSFAPEISPSNRATIGGMVNTDACGIGSRILGRTSDHVLNLTCVLHNGQVIQSSDVEANQTLKQNLVAIIQPHQELIDKKFTSAPRTLNGYNLKKAYTNHLNLNYLLCGSEGTLAVVSECKLKLTPIPKYKKLIVVKYGSFDDALRAAEMLEESKPFAVEAIDEKLIDLARNDSMYFFIKDFIDGEHIGTRAVSLAEFVSHDENELAQSVNHFCKIIDANRHLPHRAIGYYIAKDAAEEKLLWELRKKSVGLISKKQEGTRRPIPFIEDTAVPPEKLADYISEFKALLDEYKLMYGMYGHVDAGCIHVRPALDMKLTQDEKLIQELSDKVVALIEKYNGVLWGEHGHGYRSVYGKRFFGEKLYFVVRQIKTLFDPFNQLNPGKIATSLEGNEGLVKLNGPMRGQFDRQIPEKWRDEFATTIACNGNGACFNYSTAEIMCPSYKVTKDRIQSPKGRATVMREWLREMANKNIRLDVYKHTNFFHKLFNSVKKRPDFSHEVFSAMSGCLSCKACAGQCPLSVDVPEFKAKFLAFYYQRYLRSVRDYFMASLEKVAPLQAKFPKMNNWFLQLKGVRIFLNKLVKIVDPPLIDTLSIKQELEKRNVLNFDLSSLAKLTSEQKENSVILIQDAFTSFYDSTILLTTYDCLKKLGFSVYVAPYFVSGKPLHVKGFLRKFACLVNRNNLRLQEFSKLNIPLVGIDPSITLTYRDEYQKIVGKQGYSVLLLQEWLSKKLGALREANKSDKTYFLLSHCTEKTMCVEAEKQWQTIFAALGLKLQLFSVGCCGMAGSYGHEAEHVKNSHRLFDMDWRRYLADNPKTILATGYSCRSQVKRLMDIKVLHPIEALAKILL